MSLTPDPQKYDSYLFMHSLGCRSPPSVLVFLYPNNQNGGLENEKDQFTGLLRFLSV